MMIAAEWSEDAAHALVPTLDGTDLADVEQHVREGSYQLWRCGRSWVVTQDRTTATGPALHVWAVSGNNLRGVTAAIVRLTLNRGWHRVTFRTLYRGIPRLVRKWNPVLTDPENCEFSLWVS